MSTSSYGSGGFGYGGYGSTLVDNDHLEEAIDDWDHPVLQITVDRPERDLMLVLLDELDGVDYELNRVIENVRVDSAQDAALERMGRLTNTSRRDGENDDYYRYRLIAEGGIQRLQPTFEELAPYAKLLLDTDYSKFSITTDLDANSATWAIEAPVTVWDDAPLHRSDLDHYFSEAVPAGHDFVRSEQQYSNSAYSNSAYGSP